VERAWGRLQAVAVSGSCAEGLMITALPLLAATVTADPQEVALVNVVGQLPWLLLSLFAGVLIDRLPRTALLGWAFAVQVLAALALGVSAAIGLLTLPLLLALAFVVVSTQVLSEGATSALLPDVVGRDRLDAANARMILIDRGVVQFLVPPLAGFLVAVASGAPGWIAAAAATIAIVLTRGICVPARPVTRSQPLREIADGLRQLFGSRLLRSITLNVAMGGLAFNTGYATFVLYATKVLGVDEVGYGLVLGIGALGWIVSSFVVSRIFARFGYAWSMRLAVLGGITAKLLIWAVPAGWAWVAAVLAFHSFTTLVWNVGSQSSRQRFTPPELLGRVLTSHRALSWGCAPLGAVLGGFVAAHWGLRTVWLVAAAVEALGLLLVWRAISPAGFAAEEDRFQPQTDRVT
jgi:MFS family permease